MPNPDRDKSVEQWLRQTPVAGARVDDCLDAETLAAWSEGVLAGQERSTAEAHAANCARCQAMLAVMVRTTPAPAAAAGSPLRKWLMMPSPAMAAAAAVALWVAVDRRPAPPAVDEFRKGQATAEGPAEVAQVPPAPAVGAEKELRDELQKMADARREVGSRVTVRTQADRGSAAARGNERADKSAESKEFAAAARADTPLDSSRFRAEAKPTPPLPPSSTPTPAPARPAAESVSVTAASPPVTVAPPGPAPLQQANQTLNQNQAQNQNQNAQNQNQAPAQNQNAPTQNQSPQRQAALEERVIVRDEKALGRAVGGTAAEGRSAGRAGAGDGLADASLRFRANAGTFDIAVPESSIRWRVIDGRTIQRSSDAGATWANHHTEASDVTLTAGVAPSSNVCWLVGRLGAITLTIDGRVWRRIKFPEPTDLASVIASDGRAATVTAADGRRFATTDGGLTWTRR